MDQTKIWNYFQNDDEAGEAAFNARPRYEFLARQIATGAQVLNIGAGRGGLEAILVTKGVQVSTLDPSEATIDRLRKELAMGERAKVGYSQSMPFADHQFDVVVMSEVLEHLSDEVLGATFREVHRVLKNGGRFIGTVPAEENLLEHRVVCPHCGTQFHRWGHVQSFSEDRLRALLSERFGPIIVSRSFFEVGRSLNWKGRLVSMFKKLVMGFGFKGGGESYYFSANRL